MTISCNWSLAKRLAGTLLLLLVGPNADKLLAQENFVLEPGAETFGETSIGERPKTLMRWSYGDTIAGGPASRDEPLISDRPDFTEASTTVGQGVAQVEMGYTFYSNSDDGVRTRSHSYPEMLWRVGILADWLEFRIAYNAAGTDSSALGLPSTQTSGSEDLYLGFKLGLTLQEGILPEMALITQMTVPTGSGPFTAGIVMPGLNWLYGWDITDEFSFAGSTQANQSLDDSGDVYLEVAQSFTIGISLTERLGMYTEWFVFMPSGSAAARTQHYLDGGFTFSVTNDLQLDVRGGIGLSHASDDYFVGTGFVRRF
ncbi:MAG: transporter [Pirellulaceae bacterium]